MYGLCKTHNCQEPYALSLIYSLIWLSIRANSSYFCFLYQPSWRVWIVVCLDCGKFLYQPSSQIWLFKAQIIENLPTWEDLRRAVALRALQCMKNEWGVTRSIYVWSKLINVHWSITAVDQQWLKVTGTTYVHDLVFCRNYCLNFPDVLPIPPRKKPSLNLHQ